MSNPRVKVYNNITFDIADGWGIHGWHNAQFVEVTNNLVIGTRGIVMGNGDSPTGNGSGRKGDGYVITNNILIDNPGLDIRNYAGTSVPKVVSHNAFYNAPASGSNAITGAPQFVNFSVSPNGDFRLKSTSPLIDQGRATYAPAYGIGGKPRTRGGAPDIGPYER